MIQSIIRQVFIATHEGYSPDAIIVAPELNLAFLQACSISLPSYSHTELNRYLLNARKNGLLRGIKTTRSLLTSNQDNYIFASEMAIRHLELSRRSTLDTILCDPTLANEFDRVASSISPGYRPAEYRWAALGLRKRNRLKPEHATRLIDFQDAVRMPLSSLQLDLLPSVQGIYMFHENTSILYIGETRNLFSRIRKHLDHSDNRDLAHWLWSNKDTSVHLEYYVLPSDTSCRRRKAVEASLIVSRQPRFNVQGRVTQ